MARRKNYDPKKQKLIADFLEYYKPESIQEVQEALTELLGGTFENMLSTELEEHLETVNSSDQTDYYDSKNGFSTKTLKSSYGQFPIDVPRDRNGSFTPQVIKKHQTDVSDLEAKIISMYSKGMSQRDIEEHIREIYGFNISDSQVSAITDKIIPEIQEWQNRPLDEIYPILFLDAIHFNVKQEGTIVKKAAYSILGYNLEGMKEVLGIWIGGNESSKYWLMVLNELKKRGIKDILICCIDGLPGFKEAIAAVYPHTIIQRCVIHQLRSSTKYVSYKDIKEVMTDLKEVYRADTREGARIAMDRFEEKWGNKYKPCVDSWNDNWVELTSYFDLPLEIRKLIYTTNAVEGYHRQVRKISKNRTVFPNDMSLTKIIYLATMGAAKKWTTRIPNWASVMNQLKIYFPRISDVI